MDGRDMRDILAGSRYLGDLAATSALAEGALRPLITADDSRGYEAIGRIDLGRPYSFCTGTLDLR
jgi:hypothetical protein